MITYNLTKEDLELASNIAIGRYTSNRKAGNKKQILPSFSEVETSGDYIGALAEIAVCRAFELPLPTFIYKQSKFREIKNQIFDAGIFEVRGTHHLNGRLILHKKDAEKKGWNTPYILVRINLDNNSATLVGWATPHDGIKQAFWNDKVPKPAYFVSNQILRPISKLPGIKIPA